MNAYLVLNNKAVSRFIICANSTERAYELAKEKSNNEVFDRSFLLGKSYENEEKVLREVK